MKNLNFMKKIHHKYNYKYYKYFNLNNIKYNKINLSF